MDPQKLLIWMAGLFLIGLYLTLFAAGFKPAAKAYYIHKPVVRLNFYRRWLRR